MTDHVITTNLIVNGAAAVILADGDAIYVAQNVLVASPVTNSSFYSAVTGGNGCYADINGAIYGSFDGLYLGNGADVTIGATGSLYSQQFGWALYVGQNSVVDNAGLISGGSEAMSLLSGTTFTNSGTVSSTGAAVFMQLSATATARLDNNGTLTSTDGAAYAGYSSGQSLIGNSGHVFGKTEGFALLAAAGLADSLVNSGTIQSDGVAIDETLGAGSLQVDNSGSISSTGAAINFDGEAGATDVLTNLGAIAGGAKAVVEAGAAALRIVNSGSIVATSVTGVSSMTAASSIDNSGLISGAVTLSGAGSRIVNDGLITGAVTLGSNAILNSTFGKIRGTIRLGAGGGYVIAGLSGETVIGGSGADTLIANPNAAATTATILDGGAGHDKLYGAPGDETFVFRSFAAADSDVVRRFSVADDTIELDHTVFTDLAAGKTPAFAIDSKATSASDHLFYNSATGNLNYDLNGSAPGDVKLIANFSPGLKLTAADFEIV